MRAKPPLNNIKKTWPNAAWSVKHMTSKYDSIKDSRGIRNNNPANIKYSIHQTWQGQRPQSECSEKTFCVFYHVDFGLRAAIVLLHNYLIKGFVTPLQIIERFAPSSENFTKNYVQFVCSFFDDDPFNDDTSSLTIDSPIKYKSHDFYLLVAAICMYESNYRLTYSHYCQILKDFNL